MLHTHWVMVVTAAKAGKVVELVAKVAREMEELEGLEGLEVEVPGLHLGNAYPSCSQAPCNQTRGHMHTNQDLHQGLCNCHCQSCQSLASS
jgi:hypothetical protein